MKKDSEVETGWRQGTVLCLPSLIYCILYDYLDIIFISYGYFSIETKRE